VIKKPQSRFHVAVIRALVSGVLAEPSRFTDRQVRDAAPAEHVREI
jgi:hypothetical protein